MTQPPWRPGGPTGRPCKLRASLSAVRGWSSPRAATTVSIHEGKRQVHDGPYAETKEFLAGLGIIDVPDLDAALEWAARHPAAAYASIEVRPLLGSRFQVATAKL